MQLGNRVDPSWKVKDFTLCVIGSILLMKLVSWARAPEESISDSREERNLLQTISFTTGFRDERGPCL